jgi:hypothetical protein
VIPANARFVAMAVMMAVWLGCATRPAAAQTSAVIRYREPRPAEYHAADSIALERISCFVKCEKYRVSVTRTGDVRFLSQSPGVSGRIVGAHVDAARFQGLAGDAMFAAFFSLPDAIQRDSTFCSIHFTDSPTATVSVFLPTRSKRVVDDHGCVWTPAALRDLENAIDEVAGSKQWAYTAP